MESRLDQVLIQASGYAEVAFHHRPSRILILTDLVLNVEPEREPLKSRGVLHLLGSTAPHGEAPAYLRALLRTRGRHILYAAARPVALLPHRVIFAHGKWFDRDGTTQLRQSLSWILEARHRVVDREYFAGATVVITGASSGRSGAKVFLSAASLYRTAMCVTCQAGTPQELIA